MSTLRKTDLNFGSQLDSAGRLRVSNSLVLGEYSNAEGKNTDLINFAGTGVSTYEDLTDGVVGVKLAVTAGQYVIAETINSHQYIKGHSQKWDATTQNFQKESGLAKYIGYYSSSIISPFNTEYDGMYIESNGDDDDYFLCLTRKGTVVLRKPRADWDDKLDGTGASGLTIDWSVFDIADCDFLWLGGKGARFNFMINNIKVCALDYGHAGVNSGLIFRSPNQPIRFEIRSTTGAGYLYFICANVVSEGAMHSVGIPRLVQQSTVVRASDIGVGYLISAIRLKASRRNTIVTIADFGVSSTTSDSYTLKVLKNPTIAGSITWNDYSPTSALEYATVSTANPSTNTVTLGDGLRGSSTDSRSPSSSGSHDKSISQLTRNIDGTSDIYALVATPTSTGAKLVGQFNINEFVL